MKVVCGLGNPGAEYGDTRHNVGWWVVDRAREAWRLPPFRRDGAARVSEGSVGGETVRLLKPLTYMNRSGAAVAPLGHQPGFDVARDLLVVVDDVAIDVGRVRIRSNGTSGGHNGLRSIEASLRSQAFARLRVGVGQSPPGEDLADWVLAPFPPEDETRVREMLTALVDALRVWIEEGVEAAANRFNR
jgi:PTH1 family peptidyl-tRNA hydrolase